MKAFTKPLAFVLTAASALVLSALSFAGEPTRPDPAKTIPITGTQCVHFNYATMNWEGTTLVSFAGKPAKVARCLPTEVPGTFIEKKSGGEYGTESYRLQFIDGSGSFDVFGTFQASPGATPGIVVLHEHGTITNGKGKFEGASGVISMEGPFLAPFPILDETDPAFLGELHGEISGISL